jgi:transposase
MIYTQLTAPTMARRTAKIDRLCELGMLNPQPERVRAQWFEAAGFFDANDLVQVKYEMLRHARHGGATKSEAAELFGVSRPTFYQAEAAFEQGGLAGLLPRPRGPKSAHKLTPQVMGLVDKHYSEGAPIQARALAQLVQQRLGVTVHPRSIERALARKKKR